MTWVVSNISNKEKPCIYRKLNLHGFHKYKHSYKVQSYSQNSAKKAKSEIRKSLLQIIDTTSTSVAFCFLGQNFHHCLVFFFLQHLHTPYQHSFLDNLTLIHQKTPKWEKLRFGLIDLSEIQKLTDQGSCRQQDDNNRFSQSWLPTV